MRTPVILILLALTGAARAAPVKAVVFDLELLDMSQEAATGARADEARRIALTSDELRSLLKTSGQFDVIDTAPQAAAILEKAPLHKCNGCEEDIAKALGGELEVTGLVQKTSNLILSFLVTIKDVRTGKVVRAGQTDIRGNTDETWLRGIRYLVKNRLLSEPLPDRL